MTNHENFFSQYFLSSWDLLLASSARYHKISRPPSHAEAEGMLLRSLCFHVLYSLIYLPVRTNCKIQVLQILKWNMKN